MKAVVLKIEIKQDGRFDVIATKSFQTGNLKFRQVMFNSLVFRWERNFKGTFGIFSVLVSKKNVLASYLEINLS